MPEWSSGSGSQVELTLSTGEPLLIHADVDWRPSSSSSEMEHFDLLEPKTAALPSLVRVNRRLIVKLSFF